MAAAGPRLSLAWRRLARPASLRGGALLDRGGTTSGRLGSALGFHGGGVGSAPGVGGPAVFCGGGVCSGWWRGAARSDLEWGVSFGRCRGRYGLLRHGPAASGGC